MFFHSSIIAKMGRKGCRSSFILIRMHSLPYITLYTVPGLVAAVLALLGWQRRYYRGGRSFSLMMSALSFWFICHGLAIAAPDVRSTLHWMTIQYGGIMLVAPAWLLFALAYSGQWWRTARWMRRGIFVLPVICYSLALTNDLHRLWWSSWALDEQRSYLYLTTVNGPIYWLHVGYSYGCIVAGLALLGYATLRLTKVQRYAARLVLIGALIPPLGNLSYLLGSSGNGSEDPTPFLLLIAGAMVFYAMLRYQAVDLEPMAEREVFRGLPDGVFVLDSSGMVASHNALAAQMLGVPAGRLVGRSLAEASQGSALAADLRELLRQPYEAQTQLASYEQQGQLYALEIRLRPLLASNGAATGTLLVLRDITERLQTERVRARHLSELELLNTLARAANSARATDELIRLMARTIAAQGWWDRVMVGTVGPDGSLQIIADSSSTQLSSEGQSADLQIFAELQSILTSQTTRLILLKEQREESPLSTLLRRADLPTLLVVPMIDQAQTLGLLALANHDERPVPTELVRLAETVGELMTDAIVRIKLYEELRRASELKSSFLATMSHELRTPLTSIIGYIEMLERGTYGQIADRIREPMGSVRHSSMTLLNLINDILDFSCMEAGFLRIDLQPVSATQVVTNVVAALRPLMEEKQLALEQLIEPDLPPVQANIARLEQVISNLLSNAIKFTPHGTITISALRYEQGLRISIADTGVGIAPSDHEEIFKEFRRIESRQSRKVGGTGLGLAISRRLMSLMHGTLTLESSLGAGATFHCDLRLAVLDSAQPATVMEAISDH